MKHQVDVLGVEILYGIHPVFEALNAARRHFFELFVERKKASHRIAKVITLAESRNLPLSGMEFVITGRLEAFSRQKAETRIRELGGTAKDNVTRATTHLVEGTDPGSKLARAQALGTKIIKEAEFLRLLGRE